jgi:hypothetical protein
MRLCNFDVKKNRHHPQEYFNAASDTGPTWSLSYKTLPGRNVTANPETPKLWIGNPCFEPRTFRGQRGIPAEKR